MTDPLDQIIDATVPEAAVTDTLQLWLPTYVAHLARAKGLDPDIVAPPRSWQTVNEELDRWPEDQVPAIYVIATGIVEPPEKDGDGWYRATWALGVAAVVEANSQAATDRLAKLYAAAIRGALLQHRSLGGAGRGVTWLAESYDAVPNEDRRSLVGAELAFAVEIDHVLNVYAGLDEPPPGTPPGEPGDWPTADTVDVDIEAKE